MIVITTLAILGGGFVAGFVVGWVRGQAYLRPW